MQYCHFQFNSYRVPLPFRFVKYGQTKKIITITGLRFFRYCKDEINPEKIGSLDLFAAGIPSGVTYVSRQK
jgi:hypothetical protein